MRSFPKHLYDSFIRVNGWLVGLVGLIFSVGSFFFIKPDTTVAIGWLISTVIVAILVLVVAMDAAYVAWRSLKRGLPDVRRSLAPPAAYDGIDLLLLVDPSDLFAVDAMIAVYVNEDDYERLLAVGRVLTIQTNGFLQVGIKATADAGDDSLSKLRSNDASFLRKLLVKPSVPSYAIQEK
ncbi:MAG: hypothetical protein IPH41_05785 [Sulfuritalea sp.]|jgi:hypothetical protein|nr:hypothetical protein [Sulfuritalea sp.]